MREIKFRGRDEQGRWHFGMLRQWRDQSFAIETTQGLAVDFVDPATVGQFTGLTDKDGKEIYEGDIVAWDDGTPPSPSAVRWDSYYGYFVIMKSLILGHACKAVRVIGNIHDNPELLEGEHD